MPDDLNSAAALRARLDHHRAVKSRAEAERARLFVAKAEAGARLPDDEIDAEVARLAAVIERAASSVEMIGPALAKAEAAEAGSDDSRNSAAMAEQNRRTIAGIAGAFGDRAAGEVIMTLKAANAPVLPPAPTIFDAPPAPRMARDDASWWQARERREREAKAARRLSAKA